MLLWWVHRNDREVLLWRVHRNNREVLLWRAMCCNGGLGVVMAGSQE